MHSTACGVGASATNLASLQTTCSSSSSNSNSAAATADAHKMVHHNNDDAMNKIPLKSASGLDDEEKNGGELMQDTAAAEEARREQMRANLLAWSKKLTIGVICFIGIGLISYVLISLCFSDWPKSTPLPRNSSNIAATTTAATATTLATDGEEVTTLPPSTTITSTTTAATTTTPTTTSTSTTTSSTTSTSKQERSWKEYIESKYASPASSFEHAAICSDQQICSDVGRDILAKNGSAVDAMIATMLCNGITSIEIMGIGGGFIMNIFDRAHKQAHYIDAHPMAVLQEQHKPASTAALSISVPGEVMGYHLAHRRFGKLPWRELVAPALKICDTGFTMSEVQEASVHRNWHLVESNAQYRAVFANPKSGKLFESGSLLKPPKQLCNTYQLLADNGPMDFYNGTIAQLLLEDLKELGSIISQDDLNAYKGVEGSAIAAQLGNDTLYSVPPISGGIVVSQILSILNVFNMTRVDLTNADTYARAIHRILEASKLGFVAHGILQDPSFRDMSSNIKELTDLQNALAHHRDISDDYARGFKANTEVYVNWKDPYRSSCFTVIAPNGDAVSATSSINSMRANMLAWMKKLTIGLICFIGIALISYVIISLCFSDWPKSTPIPSSSNSSSSNSIVATTSPTPTAAGTTTATAAATMATTLAAAAVNSLASPTPTTTATTTIPATTTISTTSTNATTTTTTTLPTTSNPSTSQTFITSTPTDEQPLPSSSEQHNDNMKATTPMGDLSMAGPAVAASTSPTTPPPSAATKLEKNSTQIFESKLGVFQEAAVCSDSPTCSQIGSDILAKNGSAVDATIATMLCNGLLTAQSMGIGGGLLMNIYDRQNLVGKQIDAHMVAPYASDQMMYDANPKASFSGPLSIAVPGEVMGYHLAHEEFGKLPWRDLVAPSLKLCETGYRMSKHQENSLRSTWSSLKTDPQYQAVFLNAETGEHYTEGDLIKAPKQLCNTYQLLADNGPMDFYNGTIAQLLAEDLKELGSIITQDDLNAYAAEVRLSDTMPLGKDTLYAVPPVSSGSVVSHVLSILEGFNFTRADMVDDESYARTVHRITEALKFGFASRSQLGDPRFNDLRELVSQLNNPENAAQKRAKINDSHVLEGPQEYGAQFSTSEDPYGTSHLAVLAPNGDAVSVTSSINFYFGSRLIGPRTGIILNNGMNDFALSNNYFGLPPSPANTIDAHKRPMSSQSPMLLADHEGNIKMAIGGAGGTKIIPAIVEVAARFLWLGDDLKAAVDAPRFYHQLSPDVLEYENGSFTDAVVQLLEKRGHNLKLIKSSLNPASSTVCAIGRNATAIYANADRRKRGDVAGF